MGVCVYVYVRVRVCVCVCMCACFSERFNDPIIYYIAYYNIFHQDLPHLLFRLVEIASLASWIDNSGKATIV